MQSSTTEAKRPHTVTMEERKTLSVTGVERVQSCDESGAVLKTSCGTLTIQGKEMRVGELSTQSGEVKIYGTVDSLVYSAAGAEGGFWRRLAR